MFRLIFVLILSFSILASCGSRDLSRGDGEEVTPDPLSGLTPDRFFLLSKNTDFIDVALRQVSDDMSSVFFTDIIINLSNNRVSFENESVGELNCQLSAGVNTCNLVFFTGITGPFAIGFEDSYTLEVIFENTEAFVFDDAPATFSSNICDSTFGPSANGEKLTVRVLDKDDSEVLTSFFFYDFGFQNQGQLAPLSGSINTSVYYGVNLDQFFTASYSFSGVRKNIENVTSYLEIQAVQSVPVFKRSLVCFND